MQARQERTLRAALSALVCTLVTATAHAAAGGGIDTLDGAPLTYGKPGFRNPGLVAWGRRR